MPLYKIKLKYTGTKTIETHAKNKTIAKQKAKNAVKTHIQGNAKSKILSTKKLGGK